MFRLAHLSDIHLGPLPEVRLRELLSKRITGYINWHRHRKINLDNGIIDALSSDMLAMKPDHIALSGDLVNLGLDREIEVAGLWLQSLGAPDYISVVPGNHDAYVRSSLRKACEAWGPYMRGDGDSGPVRPDSFPYLRIRGPIALIGLSSARATAPFMATGYFRERQARATAELLDRTREMGLFRVLMIHHPPIQGATHPHKRLFGITRFQKMVWEHGAELVLHGHTHLPTIHTIMGPGGARVPVVGVAAAGQAHGSAKPPAHYNLFHIDGEAGHWRVLLTRRGSIMPGGDVVELSRQWIIGSDGPDHLDR